MKILAIDTSGKASSSAVVDGGRLLAKMWLEHGKTHSQALMPCIESMLSSLGAKVSDMDVFAAVTGPGSFTGLRIGVTTIKALAYANNARVAAVSTFECLAFNLFTYASSHANSHANRLLCPVIDARNSQVYYQVFIPDGGKLVKVCEEDVADIEDVAVKLKRLCAEQFGPGSETEKHSLGSMIEKHSLGSAIEKHSPGSAAALGCGIVLNGDAAREYLEFFSGRLENIEVICALERDLYSDAASAALIVSEEIESGELSRLEEPYFLAPNYMRKPQAERLREEAEKARNASGGQAVTVKEQGRNP